jgi:hypothetical protein
VLDGESISKVTRAWQPSRVRQGSGPGASGIIALRHGRFGGLVALVLGLGFAGMGATGFTEFVLDDLLDDARVRKRVVVILVALAGIAAMVIGYLRAEPID